MRAMRSMPMPPGEDRHVDAQGLGDLGTEDARTAKLEPAEDGVLDMNLDGGLGEGEVAGHVLDLGGAGDLYGEHLEKAEEGAQVHFLSKDYALGLIEVGEVSRVDLIIAEAARDAEVFSRHLSRRQLMGGEDGALTAEEKALGEFAIETIVPTAALRGTAILVGRGDGGEIGLLDKFGLGRVGDIVDVMYIAGRVELGHEKSITVPEFRLDETAVEFLEAEGSELVLHALEEFYIGVATARDEAGSRRVYVVGPEGCALPEALLEDLGRDGADFLARDTLGAQFGRHRHTIGGELISYEFPLRRPKGRIAGAALPGDASHRELLGRGKLGFGKNAILGGGGLLKQAVDSGDARRYCGPRDKGRLLFGVHGAKPFLGKETEGRAHVFLLEAQGLHDLGKAKGASLL